jgi:hypothetical protein
MWYYYLAAAVVAFWWFLLRPRGGGKNSPPLVTSSSVVPIPLVGVIAEFLKNPNEMMKRCYKDYGQVFTIPVSGVFHERCMLWAGMLVLTPQTNCSIADALMPLLRRFSINA